MKMSDDQIKKLITANGQLFDAHTNLTKVIMLPSCASLDADTLHKIEDIEEKLDQIRTSLANLIASMASE